MGCARAGAAGRAAGPAPGKQVPQAEVAGAVRMGERWYRDMERGTLPRLAPRVLDPLADVLLLDADERATLHRHACGGTQPFALWRACKYCVRM